MKWVRLLTSVSLIAVLMACGQKGPLVLPDKQKPKRVIPSTAKPAPKPSAAPAATPGTPGPAAPNDPASATGTPPSTPAPSTPAPSTTPSP